ncbi:MAG: energy-coupling factor transporter transmembrane component T family protein [Candidatus Thorarchaeota archaeon]
MAAIFEAFRFKQKDTFMHSLDPRTTFFMAVCFSIIGMLFLEIIPLLLILLMMVPFIIFARSIGQWTKSLRGLAFLAGFILIINTFFLSLSFAISTVLRLIVLMTAFSLFFLTVHPDDFALALIKMRVPYEFAFAFSMAVRYVPTIATETETIRDAQMSRGLELERGNILQKVRNYIPILIPIIVSSIRRALQVAESLESRAFGSTTKRTSLYDIRLQKRDYVMFLLTTTFLLVAIYIAFIVRLQAPWLLPDWFFWHLPL